MTDDGSRSGVTLPDGMVLKPFRAHHPAIGPPPVRAQVVDRVAVVDRPTAPVVAWATPATSRIPSAPPTAPPESATRVPAHLEARGVSCWFGERKVLSDVDLVMPPARITALIGPSGCGKSTFLRSLNRLHELIASARLGGSILLNGQDIYDGGMAITAMRERIGMVFQRPNPFPAMTIRQNVLAGLRLSGRRADRGDDLVESCLRRAGLWNEAKSRLHSSGASLSGGQQQRLCIARSLAVNPEILLMDEPCSALDPISTRLIEETLLAIKDDVTIVIVTHNMGQASRVSDQCALFLVDGEDQPGRIVEAGSTADVFNHPVDPRTADYIAGRFG